MGSFYDAGALKVLSEFYGENISNARLIKSVSGAISSLTTADDKKASGASNALKHAKEFVEDHFIMG